MKVLEYAMNTTGMTPEQIALSQAEYEAFMAGFLASGEGFNGEYVGATYGRDPERAAFEEYRKWKGKK